MDIDVNQLANSLNAKIDLPQGLNQSQIDYVVDWKAPTEADPTWYRVYKSGWVEQGGYLGDTTFISKTITLLKDMLDTNYTCVVALKSTTNAVTLRVTIIDNKQIQFERSGSANVTGWWQVSGQGVN